jgi:hypothetical protein
MELMKDKGLGDTVSNAIKKVSGGKIKECGGCSKRREWLNNKMPYRQNALAAIDKIQGNN